MIVWRMLEAPAAEAAPDTGPAMFPIDITIDMTDIRTLYFVSIPYAENYDRRTDTMIVVTLLMSFAM